MLFIKWNRIGRNVLTKLNFSTHPQQCYLPRSIVLRRVGDVISSLRESPIVDSEEKYLVADFKLDSLRRKELLSKLEEEFCVKINLDNQEKMLSVKDIVTYFSSHPKSR
jgi:acyl carrier protein